jgi:hypothetical protein
VVRADWAAHIRLAFQVLAAALALRPRPCLDLASTLPLDPLPALLCVDQLGIVMHTITILLLLQRRRPLSSLH